METRGTLRPSRVFSIGSRHRSKHGLSLRVAWRSAPTNARLIWVLSRPDLRFYAGHQSRFHYFGLKGSSRRRGSLCGVRLQGSKVEAHRSSLASLQFPKGRVFIINRGAAIGTRLISAMPLTAARRRTSLEVRGGPGGDIPEGAIPFLSVTRVFAVYWHQRKEQVPVHVPKFFCPLS